MTGRTVDVTTAAAHAHGRTCYWDHLRCSWVCGPTPQEVEPRPVEVRAPAAPVPAG